MYKNIYFYTKNFVVPNQQLTNYGNQHNFTKAVEMKGKPRTTRQAE